MRARCRSAAALALIALVLGACAPGSDNSEPNINNEPDDNRPAQTAAVFAEFDDASPGCAVAVRYDNGATHLDQFSQADLALDEIITVGDLVHHTSGLPISIDLLDAGDDEVTTMTDARQS